MSYVGDTPLRTEIFPENDKYRVVANQALEYHCRNHVIGVLDVKPGYIFDGASIPEWAWGIAGHPFDSDNIHGAVPHDILYESPPPRVTRKMADRELLFALKDAGVPFARRRAMYWAVRVGGRSAWRDGQKRQAERIAMLNAAK